MIVDGLLLAFVGALLSADSGKEFCGYLVGYIVAICFVAAFVTLVA
jgi:hypothetical protein